MNNDPLGDMFGGSSLQADNQFGSSTEHPFKQAHNNFFSYSQSVDPIDQNLNMDCMNCNEWKGLLPAGLGQGILYSGDDFEISLKRQRMKYLTQYSLSF